MRSGGPSIVHIGIDGGSFSVLDALAERGLMPEYLALRREAGWAQLRSTLPWFTVPAWISWMTGVRAERHGRIYWTATAARDYWERRGPGGRFVASTDVPYPTVFRILSNAGFRVASVNMPVTFPPPAIDGVVVSGFLAPPDRRRVAYPRDFLAKYPDYRIDLEVGPAAGPARMLTDSEVAGYAHEMSVIAEARHQVMLDLLPGDYGLASVVYVGPDRLSHVAWPQIENVLKGAAVTDGEKGIEDYYRTLDRLLAETRRAAADAVLLVSSDHGQGPPPTRLIAPNVWLRHQGWLSLRSQRARRVSHAVAWTGLRRRLWGLYRKIHNAPLGSSPFVDWGTTSSYAIPMPHCRAIGLAVRGDRPLQDEIAHSLVELTDAETGKRPIERVLFASEICEDYASSTYPELIALLRPNYGAINSVDGAVIRTSAGGASGYHEPEGILMAVGSEVLRGYHPEASICDIAPTILAMCGIEPLDEMDGRPIPWLARSTADQTAITAAPERASGGDLQAREEEQIAWHLRSLGYID